VVHIPKQSQTAGDRRCSIGSRAGAAMYVVVVVVVVVAVVVVVVVATTMLLLLLLVVVIVVYNCRVCSDATKQYYQKQQ
jgi:uncharacterized membrane protein